MRSQAQGVQVPEFSWLSLNKRDDLSSILQAGGWGDLCPGDIIHVMITQPPLHSPGAPSAAAASPTSPAARQPALSPEPAPAPATAAAPAPATAAAAASASRTDVYVPAGDFSPTFSVLQSLAMSLSLPLPHIRRLRDGSAAVRGGDAAHGLTAVASIVGAAVCVLVSSSGGCCSAQLPLLFASPADGPSNRAGEEAWKQVRV
jgi:hypothetical protein